MLIFIFDTCVHAINNMRPSIITLVVVAGMLLAVLQLVLFVFATNAPIAATDPNNFQEAQAFHTHSNLRLFHMLTLTYTLVAMVHIIFYYPIL